MEEGNSIEIAEQARKEGFNDLRTSGLLKAMRESPAWRKSTA